LTPYWIVLAFGALALTPLLILLARDVAKDTSLAWRLTASLDRLHAMNPIGFPRRFAIVWWACMKGPYEQR
jgi:integral membrane sensor domain MASE1